MDEIVTACILENFYNINEACFKVGWLEEEFKGFNFSLNHTKDYNNCVVSELYAYAKKPGNLLSEEDILKFKEFLEKIKDEYYEDK